MDEKYELNENDTIEVEGRTLYRVNSAVYISFFGEPRSKGYIESKDNLYISGRCMVFDNAKVYEFGSLEDNAIAMGEAVVKNNARVFNDGVIKDDAIIKDNAMILGRGIVSGKAIIKDNAIIRDNAVIQDNAIIGEDVCIDGYTIIGKDGYIMSNNDYITIKGLGSMNRFTTFYRTIDPKIIRVICGYFSGTLEEFEEKVKETHGCNKYAKEYLSILRTVKIHFDLI